MASIQRFFTDINTVLVKLPSTFLLLFILLSSCRPDTDKKGWDTDILVPLLSTELNLNDIAGEEYLAENEDGYLSLVIREEALTYDLENDLVQIPDTTLTFYFSLDSLLNSGWQTTGNQNAFRQASFMTIIDINESTTYDLGGPEVTFLKVSSGDVRVEVASTIADTMFFEYQLPSATDANGNALFLETKLPPAVGGQPVFQSEVFDISGYTFNLKGLNNDRSNTFFQNLTGMVRSQNLIDLIEPTDSLIIRYHLENIIPEYVKGYMGKDTVESGSEVTDIDFFDVISSGMLRFKNAKVELALQNGFGLEGLLKVNKLKAIGKQYSTELTGSALNDHFEIPRAFDNPLIPAQAAWEFNQQNTNILQFIETLPKQIEYDVEVILNPNGNQFNFQDFAYLNSKLAVDLNVIVPLAVKMENLTLADTLEFNPGDVIDGLDGIEAGYIQLIAYNNYPLSLRLSLDLIDKNGEKIDQLFFEQGIAAGQPEENCRVRKRVRTVSKAAVEKERIEKWKNVEFAVVTAVFNTPAADSCFQDFVRFYSDYKLKVILSGDFKYHVGTHF